MAHQKFSFQNDSRESLMQQLTTCCTENTPCLGLGSHPSIRAFIKSTEIQRSPIKMPFWGL